MIDINRSNKDLYYRYKMPKVNLRHEGKSGGRTIVVNLDDISNSLRRKSNYILKYLGYELATQVKSDKGKYILNGKHDLTRIQDIIYDFIDAYVICPCCENPETFYINEGTLGMECLACGKKSKVKDVKLAAMILKDVEANVSSKNEAYIDLGTGEEDKENELQQLLNSSDDQSEKVYELLKNMKISESDMLPKILSVNSDSIKSSKKILSSIGQKAFLNSLEGYIEGSKKEEEFSKYLKDLETEGMFKTSELYKYFTRPQGNKRSLALKKKINEYFLD